MKYSIWLRVLLVLCFLLGVVSGQQKQGNAVLSTTSREDIFAGLLANDIERLNVRMDKLESDIKQNPNSAGSIAWRGAGELTLAVHAHEAGKQSDFTAYYEAAVRSFADAERLSPKNVGVYDVSGAAWGSLGDRLPTSLRAGAHETAYRSWQTALTLSQDRLATMSPHGRGEMLAGIAHAAQRTGRTEEARQRLMEMKAALPGTPFEERAQKWLDQPELITKSSVSCQSCHPQERLSSVMTKSR
jgi:hypothetical protein